MRERKREREREREREEKRSPAYLRPLSSRLCTHCYFADVFGSRLKHACPPRKPRRLWSVLTWRRVEEIELERVGWRERGGAFRRERTRVRETESDSDRHKLKAAVSRISPLEGRGRLRRLGVFDRDSD